MAPLTIKPWNPSQLRKANRKSTPSASARTKQMRHHIAASRPNGDDKDKLHLAVQQTFDFSVQSFDLSNIDDTEDSTMLYPLFDRLAGSLGIQEDEPLHTRDRVPVVVQNTSHWQFAPEMEQELQLQAGRPSTAQLRLPTSGLREEDIVQRQSCVPLWPDECPSQVIDGNGAKEPCGPATGCTLGADHGTDEQASDIAAITEPTSTLDGTPPFPTGDASNPPLGASLASAPSQDSRTVAETPHLSSNADANSRFCAIPDDVSRHSPGRQGMSDPIQVEERRPKDDFHLGASNTGCQGEDRSKPARSAKPSSTVAGAQEKASSRRYHQPTRSETPPGADRSSPGDELSGKPGPRRKVAPPHNVQDNGRCTSLDRLRQRGRKHTRSVGGHLQAGQLSDIDSDRALKRKRSTERQMTTVRKSSRLCRASKQKLREVIAATDSQTTMLEVRPRSNTPTGSGGVDTAAHLSPTKERMEPASRCTTCGLSPPILLGAAKKALAFGSLDDLLENPATELSPSQLALHVMRSYLSLIENHILESGGSAGLPSALSSRIEPKSKIHFGMVSDDESAEDRGSDGTISEGGLSIDEPESDADHRGQRRRWSLLDERRLTAYMKENLSMPWVAARLNRSESAITQRWRIMTARQEKRRKGGRRPECRRSCTAEPSRSGSRQGYDHSRAPSTVAEDMGEEEECEVKKICGDRKLDDGGVELLVRWKGGEETWEPYENLAETEALDKYESQFGRVV